jgi:hypothetical protein
MAARVPGQKGDRHARKLSYDEGVGRRPERGLDPMFSAPGQGGQLVQPASAQDPDHATLF